MNVPGVVFWVLVAAGVCFAVICVGLLGAVINVSHLEAEQEERRRHARQWEAQRDWEKRHGAR